MSDDGKCVWCGCREGREQELEAEVARMRECMRVAGLQAFMRDKPPEEVAEHLRAVAASNVAETKRLLAALDAAAAAMDAVADDLVTDAVDVYGDVWADALTKMRAALAGASRQRGASDE